MTDRLDEIRTYDTGDLTRLGPDCPPITMTELIRTLITFKQKAPGPTGITTKHIKNLPRNMLLTLLNIFNHSLSAGYFPDKLKKSNIILIPKPNKSQYSVTGYRPISLLDIHGKLFDKILNRRLTRHLDLHNIHNPDQHGFRRNRGTHTAISAFWETIAGCRARDERTDVVLRDVEKAFDRVWHTGLKYKILQLGLHPCFTKTLTDFLTDRTAAIKLNTHLGPYFPLHSGVPQGACLSPTLYSLYTHDLPPPVPDSHHIIYADDITQIISVPYKNVNVIAQNTSHAIENINRFEAKWKIQTSQSKFTLISHSRRKRQTVIANDTEIDYSNHGKILGLNIKTFSNSNHPKIRAAIGYSALSKLQRFRALISPILKIRLIKSIIIPTLVYPQIPQNTLPPTSMIKLQRVLNNSLRFATNTTYRDRISSRSLHQLLKIDPINITIHNQAKSLWNKIATNHPALYQTLHERMPNTQNQHYHFKSSRIKAEGPTPRPIFV